MKKERLHQIFLNTFFHSDCIQIANIQSRTGRYYFARHMHSTLEIYRILEGSCGMEIGSSFLACGSGDFVLILPNIVHSLSVPDNAECTFEHIHFSPEMLSEISLEEALNLPVSLLNALTYCFLSFCHIPADTFVKDRVHCIVKEMTENRLFSRLQMNLLMTELLIHLVQNSEADFSSYTQKYSTQNMYVLSALQYIEQNYEHKIEIGSIASQLHISGRYLNKLFQKHTNMTLHSYINVFRMNRAILLLADPALSLTEIAARVGMNDSQHFSKLFKNIIGSSPSLFRKTLTVEETRREWLPPKYDSKEKNGCKI